MEIIAKNIIRVDFSGTAQLVCFGLPLPVGVVSDLSRLRLIQHDQVIPLVAEVSASWPDGSVRWAWCKARMERAGKVDVALCPAKAPADTGLMNDAASPLWVSPGVEATGNDLLSLLGGACQVSIRLTTSHCEQPLLLQSKRVGCLSDALTQTYTLTGDFDAGNGRLCLSCDLSVCRGSGATELQLRLHNPQAAEHSGGSWDLGDPASIIITEFALIFRADGATTSVVVTDEGVGRFPNNSSVQFNGSFILAQQGSGGEHWKSPIHWDANKISTVQQQGFVLKQGEGVDANSITGLRAMPVATLTAGEQQLGLLLEGFWQNFPTQVSGGDGELSWSLFPQHTELQGGESKTWLFRCGVSSAASVEDLSLALSQRPKVHYEPDYLNRCQILPHLMFSPAPSPLGDLIQQGLTGESNFFTKREQVDVYGWRHYGELYADHECHGLPEQPYFISHYNNQYDPLMGMTLQYLHDGNTAWLDLIQPLNKHVQDIDIYDTEQDKAEYNGGLFWHTNHYLPAETCSHRSYSKYHTAVYDGYQGGGGPGGQHCYTTGLALQYHLFGDQQAKQKVEQLCAWVRCFYNGSGSLLDRTFRFLTIDFKQNTFTNIGIKAPGYRYPLDRGTGNYLVALLDCYDVTGRQHLLVEVADVIRQTCHPEEDIELRDLHDIENAWFYTVFLQAVGRFLFLKETLNQIDDDYWYARHSLMHYGQWMLANEGFYLDKPELLEFPNDTWCAQELRKANLFCYMYYFSAQENRAYLDRAEAFYHYIEQRLQQSPEAQYTRLLVLMMQNDGVKQKFQTPLRSPVLFQERDFAKVPSHSVVKLCLDYIKDIARLSLRFSFARERQWLMGRLKSRGA